MDQSHTPPENFRSNIANFCNDLTTTFPEFAYLWKKWTNPKISDADIQQLFQFCLSIYPERFFDILNQNNDIFNLDGDVKTTFLPNVEFKMLFHCPGTSESTRKSMWKYLQLILFTVVGSVKDKVNFGDAMNMFNGLDESDLQDKLKDAMENIGQFFNNIKEEDIHDDDSSNKKETKAKTETDETDESNESNESNESKKQSRGFNFDGLPKPEDLHSHLKNLFEGKLGSLAKELAEEIGDDLTKSFSSDEMGEVKSTQDVFKKLMQNPGKISGLVKTVGEKLSNKINSGEISQEEIMKEAGALMQQMKNMGGGTDQFNDMFKNMARSMGVNLPKNAKIDTNALTRMTEQKSSADKMRQRMALKKQKMMEEQIVQQAKMMKQHEDYQKALAANNTFLINSTENPHNFVFQLKGEEKQEKTSAVKPAIEAGTLTASQKKRNKKKNKKAASSVVGSTEGTEETEENEMSLEN